MLTIKSRAKINLGLWVGPRRSDGFHEILTTLIPIEFGDRIDIKKTKSGIKLTTTGLPLTIPTEKNLAYQSAQLFFKTARVAGGCWIKIQKRVPPGSGLGGGSSNAGATLLGLNRLYGYPLSKRALSQIALKLGSDVRFFLFNSPAVARGRGEKLRKIKIPQLLILLYLPGFPIATAWAYQEIDRHRKKLTPPTISPKILALKLRRAELTGIAAQLKNSFEPIVFERYPQLKAVKEAMLANGCYGASLSGSGSTVYGLVKNQHPMAVLARLGIHCVLTRSIGLPRKEC